MSIDSVTSYNPNNVNDTLYAYQSNRTVATNSIQQVPKTNYANSVSLETPPDTFEGVNGVKTLSNKNKEQGMSTGLKALLWIGGTAAAVYGAVVGHRALTKPSLEKVAKNFSKIFRRDVSKEEAEKLVSNYKEILNIEDTEEFIKKAFEQVKKDYGYEKVPIKLDIKKVTSTLKDKAGWHPFSGNIQIELEMNKTGNLRKINKYSKKSIIESMIHEFQHVKQDEISYRTASEEFIEALRNRQSKDNIVFRFENILKDNKKLPELAREKNKTVEEYKKYLEECINRLKNQKETTANIDKNEETILDEIFKGFPKLNKESKEYELGQKYIQNSKNYITPDVDPVGYEKQLLEAEAYGTEPKFEEIYNSFANIWRIPFFQ